MKSEGKTAVVTAGAHGMGRCVAERLSQRGANVVIADVDGAAAQEVAAALPSASGVACDVRVSEEVERARDLAFERFGEVDLVMSHAGVTVTGLLQEVSDADWTRILDLNVIGMARVLRAFHTPPDRPRIRACHLDDIEFGVAVRASGQRIRRSL